MENEDVQHIDMIYSGRISPKLLFHINSRMGNKILTGTRSHINRETLARIKEEHTDNMREYKVTIAIK